MAERRYVRAVARDDRGFTLLEALIAGAIITLIAFSGLAACKTIARVMLATNVAQRNVESFNAQTAQLRNDAAAAFAVFLPPTDMNGRENDGQEVDFYAKAAGGGTILWRYFYDAAAHSLQRWDYDSSGATGVRNVQTGLIDAGATYPPLTGVTRFSATALPADRLTDPTQNAYSGIAGLFDHTPAAFPVRYSTAGSNVPAAVGGNGVVQVAFADADTARLVHLAAGSMPTGFTVTGTAVWHAIVYRVDQTHRFAFGVAAKSHVFINARVDISYDGWKSKIAWCDFTLLGEPDGLDAHDPHADYKPDEPIEQAPNILAACRRRHPLPPRNPVTDSADAASAAAN